jgi:hypothetical protein
MVSEQRAEAEASVATGLRPVFLTAQSTVATTYLPRQN